MAAERNPRTAKEEPAGRNVRGLFNEKVPFGTHTGYRLLLSVNKSIFSSEPRRQNSKSLHIFRVRDHFSGYGPYALSYALEKIDFSTVAARS